MIMPKRGGHKRDSMAALRAQIFSDEPDASPMPRSPEDASLTKPSAMPPRERRAIFAKKDHAMPQK